MRRLVTCFAGPHFFAANLSEAIKNHRSAGMQKRRLVMAQLERMYSYGKTDAEKD